MEGATGGRTRSIEGHRTRSGDGARRKGSTGNNGRSRSVEGGEPAKVPMRVYFGCQTHESGMFYRQQADGIVGMQPPRARPRVPSVLTSLVPEQRSLEDVFMGLTADAIQYHGSGPAEAVAA